jgi:hypothetical protein
MSATIEDGFENFASVLFAAAENHDFAYCVVTPTIQTSGYKTPGVSFGKSSAVLAMGSLHVKPVPVLQLSGSSLFQRRAAKGKP